MAQPGFALVMYKVGAGSATIGTIDTLRTLLNLQTVPGTYDNLNVQLWSGRAWITIGDTATDLNRADIITTVVGNKTVKSYPVSSGAAYIGTVENTVIPFVPPALPEDAKILSKSYKVSVKTTLLADTGLLPSEIGVSDHSPLGYGKSNDSVGAPLDLGTHAVYDINTTIKPVDGTAQSDLDGVYWSNGVIVDCGVSV